MIDPARRTANFEYAIRNLVRAAEAVEGAGREVTYLNIGDPQIHGFRPPSHLIDAVAAAMRDSFTGYSHSKGLPEAREAIAAYAGRLGAPIGPDEVLITSGASEAADLVLTALVDDGDEVLMPSPGYPLYPAILNKLGGVVRYYALDGENNWQPSVNELRSLINRRTRAIVLINPNNPTGTITPDSTTRELLELALEHNLLVISDEVYRDLCFAQPPTSASVLAREIGVPVITLESLSKTHLVPGWRVGWARYTNTEKMRDLILAVNRLASGRLCSPTHSQYAIRPALEGDLEFQREFLTEIKARRDLALECVSRIARLNCTRPEAAFYMMLKFDDHAGRSDEEFVLDLLKATGVLVVHGSGFGMNPRAGYFRLVYLAQKPTLESVFDRIAGFLDGREI